MRARALSLTSITTYRCTQPRAELNQLVVDEYAERMAAGDRFPPIVVYNDGATHWLADGYHRYEAAKRIGRKQILADVRRGTKRDAVLYAVGANATHGLPRTNADKRRAVELLLADPTWRTWSDRTIAERANVSNGFVSRTRRELVTVYRTQSASARSYVTRHGTVANMRVTNIGATAKLAPDVRALLRDTAIADDKEQLRALARLDAPTQKSIVTDVLRGHAPTVTDALRVRRRDDSFARIEQLAKRSASLPTGTRYPVLLIDTPWRYKYSRYDKQKIEHKYPTMSLDEICALPIAQLATDDAILFSWAPSPKLTDALAAIAAWGFAYKTNGVWRKDGEPGPGYYFRQRHELLLVATRGKFRPPAEANRPDSVITAPRGRHSEKPEAAHVAIERMYPSMPKIELFARGEARRGWDVWGNEASASR